jgi:hypothetical protein
VEDVVGVRLLCVLWCGFCGHLVNKNEMKKKICFQIFIFSSHTPPLFSFFSSPFSLLLFLFSFFSSPFSLFSYYSLLTHFSLNFPIKEAEDASQQQLDTMVNDCLNFT